MKRRAGILFAGALLALALWSLTAYSADDDGDKKEAQQAILKLVDSMKGNKGDVKAQTAALKKRFDELEPIMWVYKSRKKGGLGIGKDGEDIEQTIGKVGNARAKGWTAKKRLDMRADLAKVADLSRALAEVADLYAKKYNDNNTGKPNPAKWQEYVKQMRKGADELNKAVQGQDAAAIQKAAGNLSASCTNCHSDFR
jgi:cytochrome c556